MCSHISHFSVVTILLHTLSIIIVYFVRLIMNTKKPVILSKLIMELNFCTPKRMSTCTAVGAQIALSPQPSP